MAIDELIAYTPNISGPPPASGAGKNLAFFFSLPDTDVHQIDPEEEVRWRTATLYGAKSYDPTTGDTTDNDGTVTVGVLDASGGNVLPEEIPSGGEIQYNAPLGQTYSLRDLRFRATTAGDGVLIIYS